MSLSMPESRKRGLGTWLTIGMILALAAAGGAGAALLLKNASSSGGMYALEPAADRLDFGEIWANADFVLPLPITNQRGQDIEIKRFAKSCNCSRVEPSSLVIPARQTREVRLILDLTAKNPAEFEAGVRDFEVSLSPEIPGERQIMSWTIRGRVRSVLQSNLPPVDFGGVSERSGSLPIKRVTVAARSVVQKITASSASPDFTVRVEKRSAAKDNQFDVVAAMKKIPKRGAIQSSLTLVPELGDGTRLPPRQLEVRGRIVSDIEASPVDAFFGGCRVGTEKSLKVTLRSLTGQAFEVKATHCEGDGLAVEERSPPSGGGFAYELRQKIGAKGEHNGKVIFRIGWPDGSTEEVVVAVSYSGF